MQYQIQRCRIFSEPLEARLLLTGAPDLAWSSYLGGSDDDYSYSISMDADGNAWVTGYTGSSGWTVGGFDTSHNGDRDAFIAKVNANGTLAWSSYLGGSGIDRGLSISVDTDGNAWVTGYTESSGWTVGGFDTSYGGSHDGFVAKINSNGTLAWSSYLGGTDHDTGLGITVDADGNAWVTGDTWSSDWTVGGFDTSYNGGYFDGFVAKINANGTLAWSSYLGGNSRDAGCGIAMDADGNAWVSGYTDSSGWTVGGYDTSHDGGYDAFVAKINANGTLAWSSYLGGSNNDRGFGISVDTDGNAWVTGYTWLSGWAVGGFDTSHNGGNDAFVAKINANGTLAWSSYLGGAEDDYGSGISVDVDGNAWVTGYTLSSGWTMGGFDTSHNGGNDTFIAKISANGMLAWSSYLAGSNGDYGFGISSDADGNAWVAGWTESSEWAVDGFDTIFNGAPSDAFIAKITDHSDITIPVFENSTFNYLSTSQQTQSTVTFDENISASLAASDFVLTNLNTNATVALTLQSISADGQSATFTFSATGNDLGETILTDGHYRIRALAGQIEDESGNALASDVDHFFDFKNADVANADQVVDFSDLLVVAQHYGMTSATFADGDVNYDGEVNFNDLLAVAQRYGSGIPELRIGRFIPTPIKSRSIVGDVFGSEAIIK